MRKSSKVIISTIIGGVILVFGSIVFSQGMHATSSPIQEKQSAQIAVSDYIDALKTKNANEMVNSSLDIRFGGDNAKQYLEDVNMLKNDITLDVVINDLQVVDDMVMVTISTTYKDGTSQVVTLPVKEVQGKWKLVVGGKITGRNLKNR